MHLNDKLNYFFITIDEREWKTVSVGNKNVKWCFIEMKFENKCHSDEDFCFLICGNNENIALPVCKFNILVWDKNWWAQQQHHPLVNKDKKKFLRLSSIFLNSFYDWTTTTAHMLSREKKSKIEL